LELVEQAMPEEEAMLGEAPDEEPERRRVDTPNGFQHMVKGCVNGHNIEKYPNKSVAQCAQLCHDRADCKAFEYGVAYGGSGGYQPRDCQLQSSASFGACDGAYYNLDLYIKQGCEIERNYDYPGADIRTVLNVASAEKCAEMCADEPQCKSFTYGKKRGQSYTRKCFLKSQLKPNRKVSDCCDSGLPSKECKGCEIERNYDYPGSDIRQVPNVVSAEKCAEICADEPQCKSFTYGKKHMQWYSRICFLKNQLKPNRKLSDCCDSGLPSKKCYGCEIERNYDYPGADIRSVTDVASAEKCAEMCADEPQCKSFTYGKKPRRWYTSRCFLKNQLKPNREVNDCCDSGLPSKKCNAQWECGIERNYDYPGGDIRIVPNVGSAEKCAEMCADEGQCSSFTYGKKRGQWYTHKCFLKNTLFPTRKLSDCCDSGGSNESASEKCNGRRLEVDDHMIAPHMPTEYDDAMPLDDDDTMPEE